MPEIQFSNNDLESIHWWLEPIVSASHEAAAHPEEAENSTVYDLAATWHKKDLSFAAVVCHVPYYSIQYCYLQFIYQLFKS
jgi:hypothetical protein